MLQGRMMDFPLTLTHYLDRCRALFPKGEVVTAAGALPRHVYTYGTYHGRVCRLAGALKRLGVKPGDRVATLSWNHHRHLEAYFAIPCMGATLHTLNLRLHATELAYIARDAEDSVVIVDRSLLPLFRKFRDDVPSVRHVIVVGDDGPVDTDDGSHDYEVLLAAERDEFPFPRLDERAAAALCYTSGTTGNPKGVLYSHRAIALHTLGMCLADSMAISELDTILPVVPMFHANAWGLPFAAVAMGSRLVLPGPKLDPASLVGLMEGERVTLVGGVPTIWLGILALLDGAPGRHDLSSLRTMIVGGSAAPPALIDGFQKRHGLHVSHLWGMTETTPLATMARLKRELTNATDEQKLSARATQGFPVAFVEHRHVSEDGAVLPWDGETMGELEVRGPWVAGSYFGGRGEDRFTADGWFKTGDVVTIDGSGYMVITDRSKDVIKSGGEWISSVALENALMAHPAVLEAAVFAGRHEKWGERPLAAVVLKAGHAATAEELTAHLAPRVAKFWLPDQYIFMSQIPRTSTGKFLKSKLRQDYGETLMVEDG